MEAVLTEDPTKQAHRQRPLFQRHDIGYQRYQRDKDTGGANAGDCTAEDQDVDIWGDTAQQRANLKNDNTHQVDDLTVCTKSVS